MFFASGRDEQADRIGDQVVLPSESLQTSPANGLLGRWLVQANLPFV